MKVKINKHGFQRNGISGESFNYFDISWKGDNGKQRTGIATLTVETDENGEYPERFNGSCRVVTPNEFDDKWRGDWFEEEIRAQHKTWYT